MGNAGHGVNMAAGAALTVQDCLIANLVGNGIWVDTAATVRVADTTIRDNANNGIYVLNGARAFVTGATISGNGGVGIYVRSSAASTTIADIADSTKEANNFGVYAYASAGNTARVSVSDSWVVGQGSAGGDGRRATGARVTRSKRTPGRLSDFGISDGSLWRSRIVHTL